MSTDQEIVLYQERKSGRGSSEESMNEKSVAVTSWYDNKRVLMISNFVGKQPVGKCTRCDKKKR
jgi:hypothetical protein